MIFYDGENIYLGPMVPLLINRKVYVDLLLKLHVDTRLTRYYRTRDTI